MINLKPCDSLIRGITTHFPQTFLKICDNYIKEGFGKHSFLTSFLRVF